MAAASQVVPTAEARELVPGVYSRPENQVAGGALPRQAEHQVRSVGFPTTIQLVESMPNPCPPHVSFAGLRDPKLRMLQAIPLDVTKEESHVVVNWAAVDEFGAGETLSAALDDFSASLRDLYHNLQLQNGSLGPDLARVKAVLAGYIVLR